MRKLRGVSLAFLAAQYSSIAVLAQVLPVAPNLWRLVEQQDTDKDKRITVHDQLIPFAVQNQQGANVLTLSNVYALSVLLQELKRAEDQRQPEIALGQIRLTENVVDRTHRLIQEVYWDALTRRIDAEHLDQVLADPKVRSKADYLYVPASDEAAFGYFKQIEQAAARHQRSPALKVVRLPPPEQLTGAFVRHCDGEHGLLSLKLETNAASGLVRGTPYVVPGGRFNELYYWDSYFIVLGLLADGRRDLARGLADNLIYSIQVYGKVPNANRTYYLTRSQPPLLTAIIRAVYETKASDKQWLESALKTAVTEYQTVWMGPDRLVQVGPHRLNRYNDTGEGPAPEVEPGHYDDKISPWLEQARQGAASEQERNQLTPYRFLNEYLYCGKYAQDRVHGLTLEAFFKHDRAVRESGHDTTHRFDDRTADFLPCDLNALLYKYERDFAEFLTTEFGGHLASLGAEFGSAAYWERQARARKQAMEALMWDEAQGFFFDYDCVHHKRSTYISATGLFPLWARLLDPKNPGDQERARRMASFSRKTLEQFGGLAATAKVSVESARRQDPRQWDYPYGWPPHQMLAWQGLKQYGLEAETERLAYRWLYIIARNAHDYNGTIPEKYNVVTGSHEVFVEYGNVGTKFAYIAPEGFGWMNASFQVGLKFLSPGRLQDLKNLKAPSAGGNAMKDSAAALHSR